MNKKHQYDIIVCGAGHAGCEAAHIAAKMGMKTLLLTLNLDTIAQMSCNPAIGGIAKGNIVREIDALGGLMAKVIDETGIHFRMLNTKKGPAVQAPRAQADKKKYQFAMKWLIEKTENLWLIQEMVDDMIFEGNKVRGVITSTGRKYYSSAVIVTAGTFLRGKIYVGQATFGGGRAGDAKADKLSVKLKEHGFVKQRLKTGTPPRLNFRSIDIEKCELQYGEDEPRPFSFATDKIEGRPNIPCYVTQTNQKTIDMVKKYLDQSPLYSGKIEGVGPRYCPALEDKVVKFTDKNSHNIFLELEGPDTNEIYANGLSNCLPQDVQEEIYATVPGLENVQVMRYAYAVEYDFFPPTQIKHTLETKLVEGLYFAGQVNGTSGYEEAGCQGLVAGINASLKIKGEGPFVLGRDEAYTGVLIDDLVTQGTKEPYRMFTSRAEYRLLLRHHNADRRLTPYAQKFGLITGERSEKFDKKMKAIDDAVDILFTQKYHGKPLYKILSRQDSSFEDVLEHVPELNELNWEEREEVEITCKYHGYIQNQIKAVEKFKKLEDLPFPDWFDFSEIGELKTESRQKLVAVQPVTLGQAARISGVTPADVSVLMVYLKRGKQ